MTENEQQYKKKPIINLYIILYLMISVFSKILNTVFSSTSKYKITP